jgi:hypothetical protein
LCFGFTTNNYAQTPPLLGSVSNFVLFPSAGAVANIGILVITENIWSNVGAISGFLAPSILNTTIENGNPSTAQVALDLKIAFDHLYVSISTTTTHTLVFGGGEYPTSGVYAIGAAASVAGTLTLNGQGNPNSIFIFRIGGAFTTAAATVVLTNGAVAENVFWMADGAILISSELAKISSF